MVVAIATVSLLLAAHFILQFITRNKDRNYYIDIITEQRDTPLRPRTTHVGRDGTAWRVLHCRRHGGGYEVMMGRIT